MIYDIYLLWIKTALVSTCGVAPLKPGPKVSCGLPLWHLSKGKPSVLSNISQT